MYRAYICFLDYEKAFDRVRHEPLMRCLSEIGVDGKDIKIIRNLYWDQTASVRIMNELSEEILYNGELDKDMLRLPLFSIYARKRFSNILST